ncbi:hypothetical protein VKT23_016638 [Stygiomarasmius scandens]|uniref:Cytochrome P450 n=1 Tax=Marasmiellus scandens TaxID=2682957 RepID=A0ABR1IXJ4_9AGAR
MARLFLVIPFFESWRNIRPDNLRKTLYTLVGYLPWPSARKFKYLIDTMHLTYHTIYESKKEAYEKGLLDDDVKDMPSLSLQANSTLPLDAKFTDQLVISSMSDEFVVSVLTLGGQETTTGALTRHILMLATHTSVQERLRAELQDSNKASLGRELSYEELHKLPYLDSVVREVLRLYPPVPFLWKTLVSSFDYCGYVTYYGFRTKQDTIVPLEFPIQQKERGSIIKKIVIAKGTTVCIGIAAANRSIQVYGSDALEFKPERWLGLDKGQVKTYGVYSNTYETKCRSSEAELNVARRFTFLAGSRACPGMKFALTEISEFPNA